LDASGIRQHRQSQAGLVRERASCSALTHPPLVWRTKALPSHWSPSMSTERNHLQRCMDPEVCRIEPEACCISLEAEVPEVLFEGMREFLNDHPNWDQYRLISSALASFLFQNGCSDQGVTQHYLNGLFLRR
jgi:hypothetical protein